MHLASWTLEPVRLTLRPQPCVIELRKDAGETGHFDGDLIFYTKADRAGGLRRVAELVANVLPDLGKRRLGSVHVSQCDAMSLCESLDQ